jgi:hypothetical protein
MDLSPGLAQSAFELLHLIGRQGLGVPDVLRGMGRIGGLPSSDVLGIAQSLNWVALSDDGMLRPTERGTQLTDAGSYPLMLRRTILDLADITAPPWLQNASHGRRRLIDFAPIGIGQILVEAEVAEGDVQDIVKFWDTLAALARGRRDDRLLEIGRQGERLTVEYEAARTSRPAKWVALDSNADGFDVLSVKDAHDHSPLTIEVKATRMGIHGKLFLTRREWEAATGSADHVFHLWKIDERGGPRLATVPAERMAAHIPEDRGEGIWSSVEVPFIAFAEIFGD